LIITKSSQTWEEDSGRAKSLTGDWCVFWATCGLDGGRQSTETQVVSLLGFSPPVGGGHKSAANGGGGGESLWCVCLYRERDLKNIILFSFLPGQNNRRETAIARKHEGFSVVVVPSFSGERRFPFHHEASTTCNIEMFSCSSSSSHGLSYIIA
jgi:hypothetical protein